jgi:nucleolar complex protein 2
MPRGAGNKRYFSGSPLKCATLFPNRAVDSPQPFIFGAPYLNRKSQNLAGALTTKSLCSTMAKQTKRSRKFVAKGGVKARLEKGTVTNKGKLKRKQRGGGGATGEQHAQQQQQHDAARQAAEEKKRKRDESDFAGTPNINDMDIDSFFESFADQVENQIGRKEDYDEEVESGDESSSSSEDEQESSQPEGHVQRKEESGSDDSSSDSDEDIEVVEKRMKQDLEKLKRSDPEFHEFLKENEQSLLEFGGDDEEEVGEEESEEENMEEQSRGEPTQEAKLPSSKLVDANLLESLERGALKSHGMKSLKKLVAVYKSACHLSDASRDEKNKKDYLIESSAVYDKLMVMSLTRCHEEFHYHLLGKGAGVASEDDIDEESDSNDSLDKPIYPKKLVRAKRWTEVKPILQSFLKSTLHLLSEAKDPDLLTFILKALADYLPYLTPFPRIAQGYLKSLTGLWSAPLDSSEDYQVVRLNAFLRIRQLALTQPFPFIEDCLKKTYLAYANRAKFATSASVTSLLPTLTFMGNCVVELYSLDYHSSYQHAFVYIRQLALHLRTALMKKTAEALQAVYCWQYMHCLKLWVAVLTATCKQSLEADGPRAEEVDLMRSLIFPLTEIILGVARLVPTTRHLPLRLHCVRYLQQLAATAELFIPTTSILLDVLDLKEIHMKPKKIQGRAASRGLMLPLILKLPKDSALRTSEQLEACMSEVFLLLNREVDLYRYSAGFAEFSVRICQRLRKVSGA